MSIRSAKKERGRKVEGDAPLDRLGIGRLDALFVRVRAVLTDVPFFAARDTLQRLLAFLEAVSLPAA